MPSAGGSDLGFSAVALVVAALLLICFAARRSWRLSVARAHEVRRLAWLAAQEAARAEAEAVALAYMAPPLPTSLTPPPPPDEAVAKAGDQIEVGDWAMPKPAAPAPHQCAVCYRHTTMRCSSCKAVRYCSGKCQIIHWRQGHKDECRPPSIDDRNNDGYAKGMQTNKSNAVENIVHNETKAQPDPLETPVEHALPEPNSSSVACNEDHVKVRKSVAVPGTESVSESSLDSSTSSSSTCSTFSGLVETSDDTSLNDDAEIHWKKEKSSPDKSPEHTVAHMTKENLERVSVGTNSSSVNNVSQTNKSAEKVHSTKNNYERSSGGPSRLSTVFPPNRTSTTPPKEVGGSDYHCVQVTNGSSYEATRYVNKDQSNGMASSGGTLHSNNRPKTDLHAVNSSSVGSGRSVDISFQKAKSTRSSVPFVDPKSSSGGGSSTSCGASSNNDDSPALSTKFCEATHTVPNDANDFNTSGRRAVQQLKSSYVSRHSSAPKSDISLKQKMLFPYDVFVKLYKCEKVEMHPCGLTNCGNSCYANAVLQCLAFTRPLMSYLLQGLHDKTCPRKGWCFTCEFASLLIKAKQGHSALSPIGILSHINNIGGNLGHGRQEDAHEFLRYAIDTMQSVCLKEAGIGATGKSAEETTLVQLTFGGYLCSKIKCTRCRGKSEQHERMMDVTVEINGDIGTLEEALAQFTATEVLDGENKYHCSRCKAYERAKKKLTILEAPNILTIVLKRFQSGKFGKLNKAVRFPETLNLDPYMINTDDKSPVYNLYAVVVHQDIMNAAFSGHYICYVKNTQGKWYKTDDSRVKPVDIGRVMTKNAYMLFYARCSPRAPNLLIRSSDDIKPKKIHSPTLMQQRSHDQHHQHHHHRSHSQHSVIPSRLSERLPFPRNDSFSSDSSSLLSYSDEGSCSTESTRDSTSTEELSEYNIFGGSGYTSSVLSEDSDGFAAACTRRPRYSYRGTGGGDSKVVVGLESNKWGSCSQILYSDTNTSGRTNNSSSSSSSNYNYSQSSRKLTGEAGDCKGSSSSKGVEGGEGNVLTRRSSSRGRRFPTFY